MKIEGSSVGEEEEKRKGVVRIRRNGIGEGNKVIRKRGGFGRRRARSRRRVEAESAAIQRLFEACSVVFKGPGTVPPPQDVEMLQILLDKMTPEDFGLSTDLQFCKAKSKTKETPTIAYTTIYKCNNFSMCLFFLPPTAVIPLHNHPGMTVFSKLLLGSMHIKSYDWVGRAVSDESTPSANFRPAKLVIDSDFTAPCKTCTLYPAAGGNIHTFRAITACVVLDILGPPYSKEEDRDCTYYRDYLHSQLPDGTIARAGEHDDNRIGWLEEIEMPKDLKMVGVQYLGPKIIGGYDFDINSNQ